MNFFYAFPVSDNNRGGSCNTTDDPYAQICVRNKFKNMNIKLFHLISEVNVTRFLVQHEQYERKRRLNESVCNQK